MNGGGVSRDETLLYLKLGEGWYFPHIERCGNKRTAVDTRAKTSKYPLFTTIFRTIDFIFSLAVFPHLLRCGSGVGCFWEALF
jgi:hypothetical protein